MLTSYCRANSFFLPSNPSNYQVLYTAGCDDANNIQLRTRSTVATMTTTNSQDGRNNANNDQPRTRSTVTTMTTANDDTNDDYDP